MADKTLSSIAGGSGGARLAPDLSYPANIALGNAGPFLSVTGVDISSGLTTLLSLSGKYEISGLQLASILNATAVTIVLTVDGVVIWNDTGTTTSTVANILGDLSSSDIAYDKFQCSSSLTLEAEQAGATSATLNCLIRPIL